ncbi:hypothetical protein L323_01475 [Ruminiclostridium papyrosolvens C7]|uniref:Uncharacterized protein n=1 Tax=Ruminiclostridium papyrosolvens C7 TaxID=1330534 RepID=U4R5Z5_9FIRM|nr:hypothetical protein L323_01475 [Ruminiclostridium papyrosolvens C7]
MTKGSEIDYISWKYSNPYALIKTGSELFVDYVTISASAQEQQVGWNRENNSRPYMGREFFYYPYKRLLKALAPYWPEEH